MSCSIPGCMMGSGGKCALCGLGMGTFQPLPMRSNDYQRGWDDCLKRIYEVLGEKFTRAGSGYQ